MWLVNDLGVVDVSSLLAKIVTVPEEWWWRDMSRQVSKTATAKNTQSIRFHTDTEMAMEFEADLNPILAQYAKGQVRKCLLSRVPSGRNIKLHVDAEPDQALLHRIHVPLVTNQKCLFVYPYQGEFFNLRPGHGYEINSNLPHAVVNGGLEARIHFVFDYIGVQ